MKKIFTFLFILLFHLSATRATIVEVDVTDYNFAPADFSINVGDTVMWSWTAGIHTTSSTSVPAGAISWNAPIDGSNPMFMYAVTVPGVYSYQCNIHFQMGMVAQFTAVNTTGIKENGRGTYFHVAANSSTEELKVDVNTVKSGQLNLQVYNIIGKRIKVLASVQQSAGLHQYSFDVSDLAKGIYLVRLSMSDLDVVRKIIF